MTTSSLETIAESESTDQVEGSQKMEVGIPQDKKSKKMKKQTISFRCINYNHVINNKS
jgi:solute carrier family 12 sodium/potassium/chloride transporter 2